jgi:cytochrome c-type biogenesis protein CcmH
MKKYIFLLLFILTPCFGAQDYYQFVSPIEQQRFADLTANLRCLVCQNQTIAESNAPLAADLREAVYQQVKQGQSDQAIINYLVARYGHFILYQPPMNASTIGLWFGPFVLLIGGVLYLFYYLRKKKRENIC